MKIKPTLPLRRDDDLPQTLEAITWAEKHDLPIRRPSPYHLKIGPWNYYPTRMTFNTDLLPAQMRAGFLAFTEAVLTWRRQQMACNSELQISLEE